MKVLKGYGSVKKILIESLLGLRSEIDIILNEVIANKNTKLKEDFSPITEFDLRVHRLFQDLADSNGIHLLSEEGSHELKYPCFILDPLDGTKEFVKEIPECVVSFAYFASSDIKDPRNFSWIYNPLTREELNSEELPNITHPRKRTLVSRTEFEEGLFKDEEVKVVGSIAYKLMLLANGECDRVITKRPKNIWDIAAGTHLCSKQNFKIPKLESVKINSNIEWSNTN